VPEVLRPYIPNYHYWLCDLSDYSDAEITGYLILQVRLLLLKYIFNKELGRRLPEIFQLLRQLDSKKTALEQLEVMIRYVWSGAKHLTETELQEAISEVFAEGEDSTMPTLAEKYIEQGRAEERVKTQEAEQMARQSEQKARQAFIKTIRQTLVICFQTELTQYDDQLNQLKLPALERLSDVVFEAKTLAEFEAELTTLAAPPPDEESPSAEL